MRVHMVPHRKLYKDIYIYIYIYVHMFAHVKYMWRIMLVRIVALNDSLLGGR